MNLDVGALGELLLGDGIFETLRIVDGRAFLRESHVERIRRSGEELGYRQEVVEKAVRVMRGLQEDGLWRVTLLRGGEVFKQGRRIDVRKPPRLISLKGFYFPGDRLAEHKTLNWGRSGEALRRARGKGADEVVRLSPDGVIGEAASGNLFLRIGGTWCTPRVDGLLPGVYRRALLEWAKQGEEPVEEVRLREQALERAEAMVITSAGWVAMPVRSVNCRVLDEEPAERLVTRFADYLQRGAG